MAQNITILGASYSNVPAVELPKTGGGTAQFDDTTDANATEYDILQGKTAYVNGEKVTGVATGGSGDGSVWQDNQGFVNLDDDPGTHVEVDSLSVTGSGTYTAPTGHAYSPVTVPSGTAGTPTASKGSVSNHSVTVTPSVTNSAGYISGGTKTGTGVTVTASELVSGTTITIDDSGNWDVTTAETAIVGAATAGTPTATKGTVSNHSVSVTPSVTNTAGYLYPGGTKTGTAVSVSASELVSGTKSITANGTDIDVTNYEKVDVTVSGGGELPEVSGKQVNFYDYDGKRLYAYTSQEFAQLSDLPPNPTHNGLIAQGWNWTKLEITTRLTSVPEGVINVGQMYTTESGYTEIDIDLSDRDLTSPYLSYSVNGTLGIDWGDGGSKSVATGTNLTSIKYTQHDYASPGKYTIKLEGRSGTYALISGSGYGIISGYNSTGNKNRVYSSSVRAVRVGDDVTVAIGQYAFDYCFGLRYVTIADGTTYVPNNTSYSFYYCYSLQAVILPRGWVFGANSFDYCYSLECISVPGNLPYLVNYVMRYCYALSSFTIPTTTLSIGNYSFANCWSLSKISLHGDITSIGNYAFQNCYNLTEIHVKATSPPTLSSTSLSGIPSNSVIYVPSASLTNYQGADNWSTYASQMQGE